MARSIYQAYREAYGGLPKEIWVLSVALFVNRCGAMVLAFMVLYLTNELQFSTFDAGLIFSVWGLGSLAGSYVGGKLVKPLGSIPTQIIGFTLAIPAYIAVPLFSSWWGVAAAVFIMSFTSESVRPANNVAVAQFTDAKLQTRAFGLQRMAVNLGFSIGPAVGGVLAEMDYVYLFFTDAITTGFGAAILVWYFGFQKYAKSDATAAKQKLAEENQTDASSPVKDTNFVLFLLLMLSISLIFFQFHATYPKYLEDHYTLSKPMIGLLFSCNTIIIVVLEMILLNWVKSFSLLKVIGWGGFLSCLGFGILPFGNVFLFCLFSMAIITFGEMFMFPIASGFVAKRSAGRDQGMYMSWYAMMYSTAGLIAPIIGTLLYDHNPHLLWLISLGLGVVTLAGFYSLEKHLRTSEPDQSDNQLPHDRDQLAFKETREVDEIVDVQ